MKNLRRTMIACMVAAGTLLFSNSTAQQAQSKSNALSQSGQHIMVRPQDVKWTAAPSSLPAGAQVAVLEGDPSKPGAFTMRIKLPANYRIPAHWHPADEHITVLQGSFMMGMGDELDEAKLGSYEAGSFLMMPAKMNHFAMTKEEAIIQLHGIGPWGITYVNPKDDPRRLGSK